MSDRGGESLRGLRGLRTKNPRSLTSGISPVATFAGVLLARARSRDQAAQRAHDLSTAMGTMISYSNQISDPAEKPRFMTMMGQVVLQAHLTSGGKHSANDESLSGMIALANLIKPSSLPSAASQAQG